MLVATGMNIWLLTGLSLTGTEAKLILEVNTLDVIKLQVKFPTQSHQTFEKSFLSSSKKYISYSSDTAE